MRKDTVLKKEIIFRTILKVSWRKKNKANVASFSAILGAGR